MFLLITLASFFQFVILGKDPSMFILRQLLNRPKTSAMMDELESVYPARVWIMIYSFKVIRTRIRMGLIIAALILWNLILLFS